MMASRLHVLNEEDFMRPVIAYVTIALAQFAAPAATTTIEKPANDLTIILKFDGPHSDVSIAEMKRESESILRETGLHLSWRLRDEVDDESFPDLVIVRFRGKCMMEPTPFLYDERGPLAFTHINGTVILPYSEVECDKVRSSIRLAMFGGDYARGNLLMGRALGRVLAHELYHIVRKTIDHAPDGVARRALSGAQLISDLLGLRPVDAGAVRGSWRR
jgi:hypothetical protein